jgi:hypothetical protein
MVVRAPVFFMQSAALTAALKRHIGQKAITGIVVVGHQAGEEGMRHLLKAVIPCPSPIAQTLF